MHIKDLIKKVKRIEFRPRKKANSVSVGQYQSVFKGQGMSFSEVRKYQLGDDIRRIDWNKTARFQDTFVKVMEEEKELTIILLIDISASMNYATKHQLKNEYIAEICASLGFSTLKNDDKIGAILFADKVYKIIPPKKGKKHLLAMLSQILSTDFIPTQSNIGKALEYTMSIFRKKTMLFLFSDFNDKVNEKTLKIASKKHYITGIRISDEKDNEIPNIGYAELQDIETGEKIWVKTSDSNFRFHFFEGQKQKVKTTQQLFEKSSARFHVLNTNDDYIKIFI